MPTKSVTKVSVAIGGGILLALALPLSASAHVTVAPNIATAGSYALIDVKVPNESATAKTNKIELSLPADTPFTSVSYVPVAGWDAQLVSTTLPKPVTMDGNEVTDAVTSVVWTAQPGHEIVSGQLQVFQLSLGRVPDAGSVDFPTLQTYTDGTVTKWVDTAKGAEHPAPVLYINDAPPAAGSTGLAVSAGTDTSSTGTSSAGATAGGTPTASTGDAVARGLGVGGLLLGAVGIVIAIAGTRRKASV
ncbi:MAG: YcnI family protein [Terrimesophilobacter sp.]